MVVKVTVTGGRSRRAASPTGTRACWTGPNRVGVLGLTLPRLTDYDRQLAQRLAGLVADMIVTNDNYTDAFTRVRTSGPLSLSAHMRWRAHRELHRAHRGRLARAAIRTSDSRHAQLAGVGGQSAAEPTGLSADRDRAARGATTRWPLSCGQDAFDVVRCEEVRR